MQQTEGRVSEVRMERDGGMQAHITCPAGVIPAAGRYCLAYTPHETEIALATPLFLAEEVAGGFWAAPPLPATWGPGTELDLRGPLGHGFDLPVSVQRLALVALGETVARLQPLIRKALGDNCAAALFSDAPIPALPSSLEIYPLASSPEALGWADFLAMDLQLERLSDLRSVLGLAKEGKLPCPAQALIWSPMPCGSLARCGVCAVPSHRGWKLACEDGPVLDIGLLEW